MPRADIIETVDLDNDSRTDFVVTGYGANKIIFFKNMTPVPFWKTREINTNIGPSIKITIADMDKDGDKDVFAVGYETNRLVRYKKMNRNWSEFTIGKNLHGAWDLKIADFDCDSDLDIIVSAEKDNSVVLFENLREDQAEKISTPFEISQNYPNPFNPETTIKFKINRDSDIDISVYNLLGQKVTTLLNTRKKSGTYEIQWNGSTFASGVYLYRIQAGSKIQIKKMVLMK